MKRVVFDTNVLISATFWKGRPYQVVRKASKKEIENFTTTEMLAEFSRVLHRDFDVDVVHAEQAANVVLLFSTLVAPEVHHDIIKNDPDDNMILDCAVAAKAGFIITQDKHLLRLNNFQDILILTPDTFQEHLDC